MNRTRGLYIRGSADELEAIRELAIQDGLSVYWIREKRKARASSQQRHTFAVPIEQQRLSMLLLNLMQLQGSIYKEWSLEPLQMEAERHGYKATSVSPTMCKLQKAGVVNRVAPSTYRLVNGKQL